jgi:hypothetical protein
VIPIEKIVLNLLDTNMNESISFTKVYNEIARGLPDMGRIKLLIAWMSLSGLEQRFPNEGDKIRALIKKIDTRLSAKARVTPKPK